MEPTYGLPYYERGIQAMHGEVVPYKKKFVRKIILSGKKCVGKGLSEKENCWGKIFVRKKNCQKKNFHQKKILIGKKIVTDFVADFVSDKSMCILYSTYNKTLMSCSNSDDIILTMSHKT